MGINRRRWTGLTALAAAGALALSACGGSGGGEDPAPSVTADKVDEVAALVPEDIASSGKLVVGVNIPYAPNEFKDENGELVGFDVDLMNAVAGTMGLTTDFREADFGKIIPSIQGGTFNVGMSSFTDTKEREATVDFVTYYSAGVLWAQPEGSDIDPTNACGKKVAVQATTYEETDELPAKSKACTDAGKPAIEIVSFDGQDAATNAVVLGQVDAMSADSPVTLYAIKQSNGKLVKAGDVFDSAPYGWPVAKGSPLASALQAALEHLIETGTYQEIADTWGLGDGTIDKPVLNGAVS